MLRFSSDVEHSWSYPRPHQKTFSSFYSSDIGRPGVGRPTDETKIHQH